MDYKLLLIKWLDSKGNTNQWEHLDELEPMKPSECLSIGFLIEETDTYKTIASSISQTQVLGRITIPSCSIQNIRKIKL
ncbi:hypothetical protein ES703_80632 [subsurface metagenome]